MHSCFQQDVKCKTLISRQPWVSDLQKWLQTLTSLWTAGTNFPLENQKITEAGPIRSFLDSGSSTSGHRGLVGIEPLTYRFYNHLLNTHVNQSRQRQGLHFSSKEQAMCPNSGEMSDALYQKIPHKTYISLEGRKYVLHTCRQ